MRAADQAGRTAGDGHRRGPACHGRSRWRWPRPVFRRSPWPAATPRRQSRLAGAYQQQTCGHGIARRISGRRDRGRAGHRRAGECHVARHGRSGCQAADRSEFVRAEAGRGRRGLQHVAHLAHAAGGRARLPHHRRPFAVRPANGARASGVDRRRCRTRWRCAKRRKSFWESRSEFARS